MASVNELSSPSTRLFAPLLFVFAAIIFLAVPRAFAETVMTLNGKDMDSELVDAYLRTRVQKPLDQVTAEERAQFVDELADVFMLSTTGLAQDYAKTPEIAARIELQRMGILAQAVATKLANDVVISEEEIQAKYQEQVKLAPTQQYKARHILVETQSQAIEIVEALMTDGDFSELAKEHSKDSSAATGGDLGWFTPDRMVKPFSDAVIALGDGRFTTEPVQTQYGWHVILREETRAAEPPPLEGVRDEIKTLIQSDKLRAKIDELKAAAMEP